MYKILFIAMTFMTTSHGMITNPEYSPITHKSSKKLNKERILLQSGSPTLNPSCRVNSYVSRGLCFDYAFRKLFSIEKKIHLNITGGSCWITDLNALSFFKQVEQPRKNCLVAYTREENDLKIQHVGIVINDDIDNIQIKSKWGMGSEIVNHTLFTAPAHYGNTAFFFSLEKHHTPELILQKIKNSIQQADSMTERLTFCQNELRRLAEGQDSIIDNFPPEFSTHDQKAFFLITKMIGLNINGRDEKNRTLLMLAAQNGNRGVTELLVNYHANKRKKDSDGNTAADLAIKNGHTEIAQFLCQKKQSTIKIEQKNAAM